MTQSYGILLIGTPCIQDFTEYNYMYITLNQDTFTLSAIKPLA